MNDEKDLKNRPGIGEAFNGYLYFNVFKDFANKICALIQNTDEYEKMVINSRDRYETTLNWDVWGVKVRDIINNLISDTL